MKIYSGAAENSKFKSVKVEYTTEGTLSELAALLQDVKAQEQWIYSTKHSGLLKQVSESEQIIYSEKRLPTPFSNRDVVTDVKITQDHTTHVMTVTSTGVPNYIPAKSKLVRVPFSKAIWTVTPLDKKIHIEYTAEADPGGSIPAWVVNLFLTKGPYETFKKMETMLPQYRNVQLNFIKN